MIDLVNILEIVLQKYVRSQSRKVTFDFLGDRDTEGQDPHAQSRFSVKVAL